MFVVLNSENVTPSSLGKISSIIFWGFTVTNHKAAELK